MVDTHKTKHTDDVLGKPLTRREVLKGAIGVSAAVAFGPLLTSCGGEAASPSPTASGTGGPKTGGSLIAAVGGGSTRDTLDAQMQATLPDLAYNYALYDGLCAYDNDYKVVNALAEDITPNSDATEWTIRLRSDIVFHDGKSLTADDVVYSFQRIVNPKAPKQGAGQLLGLEPSGVTKVDDNTVKMTLPAPHAVITEAFAGYWCRVVPVGYDKMLAAGKPIGTGPFKLVSYRAGEEAVFSANTDYWGEGPYVDDVKMVIINDDSARVNALLGGTVDMIAAVPRAQASVVEKTAGLKLLKSKTGAWEPIVMRIDATPFTDVRVRQAYRLIVDRPQMIEQAYAGYGMIGNDVYSPFDAGVVLADLPQREQDLEKAKSLLKAAGYDFGTSIDLSTSEAVGPDAIAAAQVFAEQAKGAGVKVNVKKIDPSTYWGPDFLHYLFSMTFWNARGYLMQAAMGTLPDAPYNDTHWKNDKWLALVTEAFRTVDSDKRNELIAEATTIEYNEGGTLIWAFKELIDGYSDKIGGVVPFPSGVSLSSYRFNQFYLM
jgi:peptide/nickel transport system substrate-binding protein